MTDGGIVELLWARSEDALERAAEKYGGFCLAIARRVLGDERDAAEAVNETYLRLWQSVPPRRPGNLKAYMGAVCRNLALDMARASSAQKRGRAAELAAELDECVPDEARSLEDSLALREALNGFLRALPERTRTIFLRRYWYACTVGEIARDLRMSEGAVATALYRARRELREYLDKEGFSV